MGHTGRGAGNTPVRKRLGFGVTVHGVWRYEHEREMLRKNRDWHLFCPLKRVPVPAFSDEIRQSRTDKDVFIYYKQFDRLYCVVAKHTGIKGFLITAYPADKVKGRDVIWTK